MMYSSMNRIEPVDKIDSVTTFNNSEKLKDKLYFKIEKLPRIIFCYSTHKCQRLLKKKNIRSRQKLNEFPIFIHQKLYLPEIFR